MTMMLLGISEASLHRLRPPFQGAFSIGGESDQISLLNGLLVNMTSDYFLHILTAGAVRSYWAVLTLLGIGVVLTITLPCGGFIN